MSLITVNFSHIEVHDDGDNWPSGDGEIYYDLLISDTSIVSRSRDNPHSISSGGVIFINRQEVLFRRDDDYKAYLKISGWVSEADDFLNGGDDHAGGFTHVYNLSTNWGVGSHQARLSGDGVDVTVHYNISVVQAGGL